MTCVICVNESCPCSPTWLEINMQQTHHTWTYRSNDVRSQQPVGHLIAKDFHKSISIIVGLSPAVCSKGEFANLIFNTLESKKYKYKTTNRSSSKATLIIYVTTTNSRFRRLCSDEWILFTICQVLLMIQTMKWKDTYLKCIIIEVSNTATPSFGDDGALW